MKLKTFTATLLTVLAAFFCQISSAGLATEKTIREFQLVTGTGELGTQINQQVLPELRKMSPKVSDEIWTELIKELNTDDVMVMLIPVYQKHFTEEEMLEIIAFYKSPAGQRLIEKMPVVMQESFQIGYLWGQDVSKRFLELAKKRNIDLTK